MTKFVFSICVTKFVCQKINTLIHCCNSQGSGSGQQPTPNENVTQTTNLGIPIVTFLTTSEIYGGQRKHVKPFFEFLSYYKRKVYPDKLDKQLLEAIEYHIEEIEPQFRSGSFSQLWNALRVPLTEFFRPKSSNYLVEELGECLYGNATRLNRSELSDFIEDIRRDLVICKIGQILDGSKTEGETLSTKPTLKQLWELLRGPMTPLLVADLRTMVRELAQYASRFEMSGIRYQLPGKMSEIRRDVVICKVDDVFNALYDTNVKELEKELRE